jgi:CRISPR/Cas system-associated endonuclease/helicase Cas3
LLAEKLDISEECVRLRSHTKYFEEYAASKELAGRRLNFLTQEINQRDKYDGFKIIKRRNFPESIRFKRRARKNKGTAAKHRIMLFVISAPSGAGKTTIVRELLKIHNDLFFRFRQLREIEEELKFTGKDYFFLSEGRIQQQDKKQRAC